MNNCYGPTHDGIHRGSRVRFIENDSMSFGVSVENAKLLKLGNCYIVERIEVHSWHTKVFLVNFPGKEFNSVWFEVADDNDCTPITNNKMCEMRSKIERADERREILGKVKSIILNDINGLKEDQVDGYYSVVTNTKLNLLIYLFEQIKELEK